MYWTTYYCFKKIGLGLKGYPDILVVLQSVLYIGE